MLRYSVDDRTAARGCLVEALACCPDEPLYRANLADVEAALARPQRPRPEAGVDWGFSHLKPWEAATLQLTERVLGGLRGKIVLEVGGSLNLDAAVATGVERWFTCEPQVEDEDPHPNYARRKGDARAMAFADCTFHGIYSSCAFEHIHELGRALAEMARVLVPGRFVITQFALIWSCGIGHHLHMEDPAGGPRLSFNSPIVPAWGHLLLEEEELRRFLVLGRGEAVAARAVFDIYHGSYLNRMFESEFREVFAASPLRIERLVPWGATRRPSAALLERLNERHPGRVGFGLEGFSAVLQKPVESGESRFGG